MYLQNFGHVKTFLFDVTLSVKLNVYGLIAFDVIRKTAHLSVTTRLHKCLQDHDTHFKMCVMSATTPIITFVRFIISVIIMSAILVIVNAKIVMRVDVIVAIHKYKFILQHYLVLYGGLFVTTITTCGIVRVLLLHATGVGKVSDACKNDE